MNSVKIGVTLKMELTGPVSFGFPFSPPKRAPPHSPAPPRIRWLGPPASCWRWSGARSRCPPPCIPWPWGNSRHRSPPTPRLGSGIYCSSCFLIFLKGFGTVSHFGGVGLPKLVAVCLPTIKWTTLGGLSRGRPPNISVVGLNCWYA